jgi:hypothetical protein
MHNYSNVLSIWIQENKNIATRFLASLRLCSGHDAQRQHFNQEVFKKGASGNLPLINIRLPKNVEYIAL